MTTPTDILQAVARSAERCRDLRIRTRSRGLEATLTLIHQGGGWNLRLDAGGLSMLYLGTDHLVASLMVDPVDGTEDVVIRSGPAVSVRVRTEDVLSVGGLA